MKNKLNSILKTEYLLLAFLVLIGAGVRFYGVFTNSFAFTYDVGRDLLAVWGIVYQHKIPLIGATTGFNGIFYGPWWYYFLTPFFIIFSGSPQGIAFTMALIGVFSIVIGFYLGKKISGSQLGLLIAAFIAVSPTLVSLSSQIWNPNIAPLFVLLILLVLNSINSENKRQGLNYFFLGILLSISIDLEIVYGILLSIGIWLSLILLVKKDKLFKKISALILGYLVIFLPRLFFEIRHNFLMTKSFMGIFTHGLGKGGDITSVSSYLSIRVDTVWDHFSSALALGNKALGLILLVFIMVTVLFLFNKIDQKTKFILKTSLITLSVFLISVLFLTHDVWPHYLVGLPIFYVLLLSIALNLVFKLNKIIPVLIVVILFIINLNPISLIMNYSRPWWAGNASIYKNQLEVVDYVYKQANGRSFKYVVYTPPVFDYTYRYLFKWYGNQKYHYQPAEIANPAYFIIEPDPGYEDRPKQWLKIRENDGIIIKSNVFKSGIIVQTRAVH